MDYVCLTIQQLEKYSNIILSKCGKPDENGMYPGSDKLAYDIFTHAPLPSLKLILDVHGEKLINTFKRDGDILTIIGEDNTVIMTFYADRENKLLRVSQHVYYMNDKAVRQGILMYNVVQALMLEPNVYMRMNKEPKPDRPHKKKSTARRKPSMKVMVYRVIDSDESKERRLRATVKDKKWRCLAWGVRGHYRHYKSGKTVFIKSYVKGKNKSEYKGREYVLSKGDADGN